MDLVPNNLDEAVDFIISKLDDKQKEYVKSNSASSVHFGFGRMIRNEWGLWQRSSPLVKWFVATYGIGHADDISGLILNAVWAKILGKEFDPQKEADRYRQHWQSHGLDPTFGDSC